jgi:ribosomal protein L23
MQMHWREVIRRPVVTEKSSYNVDVQPIVYVCRGFAGE